MLKWQIAAGAAMMMSAGAATSEPGTLSGDGLKSAVSGRTVRLDTPFGGLPISYRADGTMSGEAGSLASYVGSANDQGNWWVSKDKLCQRWEKWLDGKSFCFTLRRDGRVVHWTRNDGQSGIATIAR